MERRPGKAGRRFGDCSTGVLFFFFAVFVFSAVLLLLTLGGVVFAFLAFFVSHLFLVRTLIFVVHSDLLVFDLCRTVRTFLFLPAPEAIIQNLAAIVVVFLYFNIL